MRSRSSSLEDILKAKPGQQSSDTRKRSAERGEPSGRAEHRGRHREPPDDTGTVQRNHKMLTQNSSGNGTGTSTAEGAAKAGRKEKGRDLSRDDLIFLLSLLEGELQVAEWLSVESRSLPEICRNEIPTLQFFHILSSLQARDEVITVLKADKLDVALLEAKYGFVTPQKVLQALQRDAIQGKADIFQEDIYEKPMEEVTPALHQSKVLHYVHPLTDV